MLYKFEWQIRTGMNPLVSVIAILHRATIESLVQDSKNAIFALKGQEFGCHIFGNTSF